jgi:hypothetical protein
MSKVGCSPSSSWESFRGVVGHEEGEEGETEHYWIGRMTSWRGKSEADEKR